MATRPWLSVGVAALLAALLAALVVSSGPPVRVIIGSDDLKEIARVIFRSPPSDAYVFTNFRQGTLSLTYLTKHLLTFGITSTPLPDTSPAPQVVAQEAAASLLSKQQSDSSTAPVSGPIASSFRELPKPEPHFEASLLYGQPNARHKQLDKASAASSAAARFTDERADGEENDDFILALLQESESADESGAQKQNQTDPVKALEKKMTKLGRSTYLHADMLTIHGTVKIDSVTAVIDSIQQWGLVAHDDFEDEDSRSGWSDTRHAVCGGMPDIHLGGYCNFNSHRANKTFTMLPKHSFLRIQARFHFIDKWTGETAFAEVDGKPIWSASHHHCPKVWESLCGGVSICGADKISDRLSTSISAIIPHKADKVEIAFSSTLSGDPCIASWGVDDVMLSVL